MRTLRRLRAQAPLHARRKIGGRDFDFTDATTEPTPEPTPEAVFDRSTGPFGRRHGGYCDEET